MNDKSVISKQCTNLCCVYYLQVKPLTVIVKVIAQCSLILYVTFSRPSHKLLIGGIVVSPTIQRRPYMNISCLDVLLVVIGDTLLRNLE